MSTPASRPWERLEARYVESVGCWEAVGIRDDGAEVCVAALFGEGDIRALCDAYNAARPTPDAKAIAREAWFTIKRKRWDAAVGGGAFDDIDDPPRIIAEAIRKGREE